MVRILALALVGFVGCTAEKDEDVEGTDADETETTEPQEVPFGYESRPANPDCVAPGRPELGSVSFEPVFPDVPFTAAIWAGKAPGDADHWFVAGQDGELWRIVDDPGATIDDREVTIDIGDRISGGEFTEQGLLGVAFHPDFATNGEIFLSYTAKSGDTKIVRYLSGDGGVTFEKPAIADEDLILKVVQPYSNHNGGNIAFGPEGYLYIGLGDGGSGGDPENNGQDKGELLGKMLRIDVDGGDPYKIPDDNPFADEAGSKGEIWAWGLRNPWRWSFDRATGELWVGDVGQNEYEEAGPVPKGGNMGWRKLEGTHCYNPGSCDPYDGTTVLPALEYDHGVGQSITGGYVYRGAAMPGLAGHYLFADFYSGTVYRWSGGGVSDWEVLGEFSDQASTFSEDSDGELYVVGYNTGPHKIVPASASSGTTLAGTLSETGCMDPTDPWKPGPGLIPYTPSAPFWSDGATKARWFAIPDGEALSAEADGDLVLPVGSVAVKSFERDGRRLETRLMVHHEDGWAGYSYVWNLEGTEAYLTPSGTTLELGDDDWSVPSSGQCDVCHTEVAGKTLGLELGQLGGKAIYPLGIAPQIDTLVDAGILEGTLPQEVVPLPDPYGEGAVDERARAWLHTNCAMCHQPGGTTGKTMDLLYGTPLGETETCGVASDNNLGIEGGQRIAPGDPELSLVYVRAHTRGAGQMPPLGSNLIDEVGTAALAEFITALESCPTP